MRHSNGLFGKMGRNVNEDDQEFFERFEGVRQGMLKQQKANIKGLWWVIALGWTAKLGGILLVIWFIKYLFFPEI